VRPCANCSDSAVFIYFPGNVVNGIAYCEAHFPRSLYALIDTEFVTPAVVPQEPVVEEFVEEAKGSKKKKSSDPVVEEPQAAGDTPVEE
jgi:hypothetical protein